MRARPRHPNKEIEAAVTALERGGWVWAPLGKSAHGWGKMLCPQHDESGCIIFVYSTPRSAANHARGILKKAERCGHAGGADDRA
ncbi:MAG: hypothetical protein RKE49_10655 [Oceanicaulis sp.]